MSETGSNDLETNLTEPSLEDFELKDVIGQGAFGKVRIVECLNSKKKYAMKYIDKLQCISTRSTKSVYRERIILQSMEHPYIVRLRYAFQDDECIYMVLDLATRGDLAFNIKKQISGFPDKVLILYAAEISSAVNHLHQNGIIHRDLKPENILVDDEGHLLLTDFNCSLSLKDKIPESRAGTLDYLAPEMFLDEPYKYSVDWWSFGIILFQCTYGCVPFKENRSEQTIESIKSKPLTFPTKHKVSGKFVYPSTHRDTFIQGLLERDIELRYGSSQNGLGFSVDIQPHPWLENINWKLLEERKIVPPFIPANVQNPAISPSECFDPKSKLKKLEKENKSNLSRIGSMTSILSNMFSKKSKNTLDSIQKSDANLIASAEPTDPSSREQIELEQLLEHFHPFSHEADNQPIVVMPPTRKYRKATNESSGSSQGFQRRNS
ncbi:kinase-like domain-containing protein [Globomyces pollinis-pini]|nr:kinase-like domain-containing protein [Globomyces pollinis-pini]